MTLQEGFNRKAIRPHDELQKATFRAGKLQDTEKAMTQAFQQFLQRLSRITRSNRKGEKAPHKPVLLLALADCFELYRPVNNRIPIDDGLVKLFKQNWKLLVHSDNFGPDITQPLHYLQSDGFWTLTDGNDQPILSQLKSLKRLMAVNACGRLDDTAFGYFQQTHTRELIRMKVLDTFFPYTKAHYIEERGMDGLILDIESDVLMDSATPRYERKILELREWEGFIRHHKFRDSVLHVYRQTCCISGWRVEEVNVIEACHIVQHAESGNDKITNGLALCPNLHLAFDLGLIGLDDRYRVIVKEKLHESVSALNLKQWKGRQILLPEREGFWPDLQGVKGHRERWGLN
jgi:putative restriction endonuclease